MPETFNSQPLFAMSIVMGLNFDDGLRRQRFRISLGHVKPRHKLEHDVTACIVGIFDQVVVKNGATLTLNDEHDLFLLAVEGNLDYSGGYSPPFFSIARPMTRPAQSFRADGERSSRRPA
jgi:hypothetical protein